MVALYILATRWIDGTATRQQEAIFNEQQLLQTALVAHAVEDDFASIKGDLGLIEQYSLPDYLNGHRTIESVELLFSERMRLNSDYRAILYFAIGSGGQPEPFLPRSGLDADAVAQARHWLSRHWEDMNTRTAGGQALVDLLVDGKRQWAGLQFPVFEGGRLRGVLVGIVDLQGCMIRHIKPMRSGTYGAGYVVDDLGNVVFDHETQIIGQSIFGGMHDGFPDVGRYDRRLIAETEGTDSYHFTVVRGGPVTRKLAAWHRADLGGRFLVVALSAPESETETGMAALRNQRSVLTAIMLLLVVALCALFFAWRQRLLVRSTGSLKDEVAQRTSELQESRDTLQAILESSPLPIAWTDEARRAEYMNPAFIRLFGYSPEAVPTMDDWFREAYPDEAYRKEIAAKWEAALQASLSSRRAMDPVIATIRTADGTDRIVSIVGAMVGGKVMAIFSDMTEGVRDRERLAASLAEKDALLRELYHRTKNNLYVIYSLLVLHAQDADSEEVSRTFGEMGLRIQSMALVHQMLYQSGNLSSIDFRDYADRLLDLVAGNYRDRIPGFDSQRDLDHIHLPLDRAVPIGLVLNELFTNAFRHAFVPRLGEAGFHPLLRITMKRKPDGGMWIEVSDNGRPGEKPFEQGKDCHMGLQTVDTLVTGQLGGSISYDSASGFRCRIDLPFGGVANDGDGADGR
jgi:PAS domain S-box-containing protein